MIPLGLTVKVNINGVDHTLELNTANGKYEKTIQAPSASSYNNNAGHYYPVTVTATDEAGNSASVDDNSSIGDSLKLFVKEKILPTIANVSPSSGANMTTSNPTISFKLLDNANGQTTGFSGIDISTLKLTVNGTVIDNSKINSDVITGGYQCEYTPSEALPEGNCAVTITVSDFDGNTSATVTTSFKIDTQPPTLNVTSPENGLYTNSDTIVVTGNTSDQTSSPVTLSIKVGSVDQGAVTISADGSFTKTVQLENGLNTITIVATDSAGKTSTVTRTITLKTDAPVIKSVVITPNPVDAGKTYVVSVEVE
jgi:hypothetical protein